MARGGLARGVEMFSLLVGITAAAGIALVETVNAALDLMVSRLGIEDGLMMPHWGGVAMAIARFFAQLQAEFESLAHLMPYAVPAADLSLIFAAVSTLCAYVWIEVAKDRQRRLSFIPIALLLLAALPVFVSVAVLAMAAL